MADGSPEGALRKAFSAIAFKKLTVVETDTARSNQHEFNGSKALRALFGPESPQRIPTEFVWMPDDGDFVRETGLLTWYDARARHPTRSEYRLYYVGNPVTDRARAGDFLVIARRPDGSTLLLLAPGGGIAAARIALMFGIEAEPGAAFAAITLAAGQRVAVKDVDPSAAAAGSGPSSDGQDAGGWDADDVAVVPESDLSIRASLVEMQREIGRARQTSLANGWSPEV